MSQYRILEQFNLILIRYSEIWLKSQKVKIRMLKILMDNIKQMLIREGIPFHKYQLSKDSSRIYFFFNNSYLLNAIDVCMRVFGIHSISPAFRTSNNLKNIIERTLEIARNVLESGDTFAIKVKRSGKHEFSSLEVAKKVGKAVLDNFSDLNLKVNLSDPKKSIFIEVRQDFSYIFLDVIVSYWGGLPIEINKKIMVMDVGRLNDLLAGFLLMRRGCEIYPILFDNTNNKDFMHNWLENWQEITKFVPFNNIPLKIVKLYEILSQLKLNSREKKYFCAICRLTRLALTSHYLKSSEDSFVPKIRAITDGITLNNATLCHDHIDLESLSLNHLFSGYPIFTSLIGLDRELINELLNHISTRLKGFEYCYFKPQNQEIDVEEVLKLYQNLKIDDIIKNNKSLYENS
ncbi:MAG: THUMP domain-containing protein [Candidatus Thorarchaeota archaeon]